MKNLSYTKAFEKEPMRYEIFDCSEKAKAKIESTLDIVGTKEGDYRAVYPLSELKIGQSFQVAISNDLNEGSFRTNLSKRGKRLGKKFCMIKHYEFGVYEIARIG